MAKLKLNKKVTEKITNAIKLGASKKTAFMSAGLSHDAFYRWLKIGENDYNNPECKGTIYSEFYDEVMRANHEFEIKCLQVIEDAADDGDWHAAKWKLSVLKPQRYAQVTRIIDKNGEESIEKMYIKVKEKSNGKENTTKEESKAD